jgi:serine/threonine protein phosphatase 1
MMAAGLADPKERDFWLEHGGEETLASYAGHATALKDDLAWFATLPTMLETAHHIFVHAGLDPRHALDDQSDRTRLWIRGWAQADHDFGKHIVYGHTPQAAPLLMRHSTCLDTGAYNGGPLSAGAFDEAGNCGPLALLQAQ